MSAYKTTCPECDRENVDWLHIVVCRIAATERGENAPRKERS